MAAGYLMTSAGNAQFSGIDIMGQNKSASSATSKKKSAKEKAKEPKMGMSMEQVKKLLGEPTSISDTDDGLCWSYTGKNIATEAQDSAVREGVFRIPGGIPIVGDVASTASTPLRATKKGYLIFFGDDDTVIKVSRQAGK